MTVKGFELVRISRGDGGNSALTPVRPATAAAGKLQCDTEVEILESPKGKDTQGRGCTRPDSCAPVKRKPYQYVTLRDIKHMVDLQRWGWSSYEIARELGCSRMTVRRHLVARGCWHPLPVGARRRK